MELKDIENKLIALVVWNLDKKGDVHVYVGQLTKPATDWIFRNEKRGWTVPIHNDKIEKIKKVTDDLKQTLLNADYFINLTIGDLVDDDGQFVPTGMKWHE
jgi:hypothetical protein